MKNSEKKLISNNKKAYHDYFIEDTYEAGISLCGTEVKSLRQGKCSIKESYINIDKGEAYIIGMNISPYEKSEINKLLGASSEEGYTIVPLSVYFIKGKVKVEIGLAKGKKLYDKRNSLKDKAIKRENERDFKIKNL